MKTNHLNHGIFCCTNESTFANTLRHSFSEGFTKIQRTFVKKFFLTAMDKEILVVSLLFNKDFFLIKKSFFYKSHCVVEYYNTLCKLRNFPAIVCSQKFRQINFLLKNFIVNQFDEKNENLLLTFHTVELTKFLYHLRIIS